VFLLGPLARSEVLQESRWETSVTPSEDYWMTRDTCRGDCRCSPTRGTRALPCRCKRAQAPHWRAQHSMKSRGIVPGCGTTALRVTLEDVDDASHSLSS
jgi:hypothetical protein